MRSEIGKTPVLRYVHWSCIAVITLVVTTCLGGYCYGQDNNCSSDYKDRAKYELIFSQRITLPPYTRDVRIVVRQKNFNRDYMLRLARTLRQRFCKDDEISVVIFDSKRVAKTMDMGLFLRGKIKVSELRGFYTLTNHGKSESIQFSTKKGNPNNEVLVKLSSH
jgi:hypothetical protein